MSAVPSHKSKAGCGPTSGPVFGPPFSGPFRSPLLGPFPSPFLSPLSYALYGGSGRAVLTAARGGTCRPSGPWSTAASGADLRAGARGLLYSQQPAWRPGVGQGRRGLLYSKWPARVRVRQLVNAGRSPGAHGCSRPTSVGQVVPGRAAGPHRPPTTGRWPYSKNFRLGCNPGGRQREWIYKLLNVHSAHL